MKSPRFMVNAKLVLGSIVAVGVLGVGLATPVAAQDDDTIILTAGGATLEVSPGNASAISAVAEAHASPGHAHTIAAAAEAIADCEDGALTRGAAALAVAHPDEGALVEAAIAEISASTQKGDDAKPIRKIVEKKCHQDKEPKKDKEVPPADVPEPAPEPEVVEVPATGAGVLGLSGLSWLFAAAASVSALGAVGLAGSRSGLARSEIRS